MSNDKAPDAVLAELPDIQRYTPRLGENPVYKANIAAIMEPDYYNGEWVRYSDYLRLAALRASQPSEGFVLVPGCAYRHRAVFLEGWSEWITEIEHEATARSKAASRPDLYEVRDLYIAAAPPATEDGKK